MSPDWRDAHVMRQHGQRLLDRTPNAPAKDCWAAPVAIFVAAIITYFAWEFLR